MQAYILEKNTSCLQTPLSFSYILEKNTSCLQTPLSFSAEKYFWPSLHAGNIREIYSQYSRLIFPADVRWKFERFTVYRGSQFLRDVRWQYELARENVLYMTDVLKFYIAYYYNLWSFE
jgi:hypothetical protein